MKIRFRYIFLLAMGAMALGAQAEKSSHDSSTLELKQRALTFEQKGERLQAAEIYEQLAEKDESSRKVLANRLAVLYAQEGCSDKSLQWASIAAEMNPDPQAYMAGIHSMLGDDSSAIQILKQELSKKNQPMRTLVLHRQLASIYEDRHDLKNARLTLQSATGVLKGTSMESEAEKLLKAFRNKHDQE
ncbi:hypothetical protein P4B35_01320 [Pontiellaceae bacterium B12227]|nr:hypothetical protein [Pontiellaceae bacterium B12227]